MPISVLLVPHAKWGSWHFHDYFLFPKMWSLIFVQITSWDLTPLSYSLRHFHITKEACTHFRITFWSLIYACPNPNVLILLWCLFIPPYPWIPAVFIVSFNSSSMIDYLNNLRCIRSPVTHPAITHFFYRNVILNLFPSFFVPWWINCLLSVSAFYSIIQTLFMLLKPGCMTLLSTAKLIWMGTTNSDMMVLRLV